MDLEGYEIVDGVITDGVLIRGDASGGRISDASTLKSVDVRKNLVGFGDLKGTTLQNAEIVKATLEARGKAKKNNSTTIDLSTITLNQTLSLENAHLEDAELAQVTSTRNAVLVEAKADVTAEAANIPLVGDFFVFLADVDGFRRSDGLGEQVTAKRGTCFRVSQEIPAIESADGTEPAILRGTFATGLFPNLLLPPYGCPSRIGKTDKEIDSALSYDVSKNRILLERDRYRYGWTYGVLVAPFKYYAKEQNMSAGATVGPYLGYRFRDRQGESSVLATSIGLANSTVTVTNSDGSESAVSETGLSVALGYLFNVKGTFNAGILMGWDFYSKSKNIAESGDLWIGVSLGLNIN